MPKFNWGVIAALAVDAVLWRVIYRGLQVLLF
jgi:hypothetical protein